MMAAPTQAVATCSVTICTIPLEIARIVLQPQLRREPESYSRARRIAGNTQSVTRVRMPRR